MLSSSLQNFLLCPSFHGRLDATIGGQGRFNETLPIGEVNATPATTPSLIYFVLSPVVEGGVTIANSFCVRFEGEDVWLTVEQMQHLFQASQQDVSHEEACRKAVAEFLEYRRREMLQYESDFDRTVRELSGQES